MLQNLSLRYAPANHSAIILSLETVFGTIAAITVAGEIFSPRMIAGCCLMFIAIGIVEFASYKRPADIATERNS
jgi:drug/metabolite transporter (DMT)-like permease